LRKSLSTDNQYQSIDRKTGQVITQIQSTSKKGVESQLSVSTKRLDEISSKLDNLNDSVSQYEVKIIESHSSNQAGSELGPLKYLSKLTGYSMDKVVGVFLVLLIFVFQPLAIALVLTSLFSFGAVQEPVDPDPIPSDPIEIPRDEDLNLEPEQEIPVKKKRSPRQKKEKNQEEDMDYPKTFDIDIPGMKPLEESQIVEKNITADIAQHIKESLQRKKKKN